MTAADLSSAQLARLQAAHAASSSGGVPMGQFLSRGDAALRDAGLLDVVGDRLRCTKAGAALLEDADGWTELTHTNGRRYRWRIHVDRLDGHPVGEKAPAQHRWELEFQRAGDWLEVRNYNRRDAIWAAVREEAMRDA